MKGRRPIIFFLTAAALAFFAGINAGTPDVPASASAEIVLRGDTIIPDGKYVALTFDDGPRADTTGRLLDGLRTRGASATFFLIGEQIAGNGDLVKRMQAEGHQVGNHTWSHVKLQGASQAVVAQEVGDADRAIRELLGEGEYWLRPPYGLLNKNQQAWFSTPLIHWSIDPEDWKLLDVQKVKAAVLKEVEPGDIILMHDFYPTSVDAALQIVDELTAQGYVFVTVEELLMLHGVEPMAGQFYTGIGDGR